MTLIPPPESTFAALPAASVRVILTNAPRVVTETDEVLLIAVAVAVRAVTPEPETTTV